MPDWKAEIRERLVGLRLTPMREAAIVEELAQHLEDCYAELLSGGVTPAEAERQSRLELSGSELLQRELLRVERHFPPEPIVPGTTRRTNMIADLWQDLRFGVRMLLKRPGFTAIVVLSMALGIGANATIFSFVNELLLRPPAVDRPEQLLEVWNHRRQGGSSFSSFEALNYPQYEHYRDHNRVFSGMVAFDPGPALISWSRNGQGEIIHGHYVSGNFFESLGVNAMLGRTFAPEEGRTPGTHPVVVIGHAFWQGQLGGDPKVIGSTMMFNGISFNVIGIAPGDFAGLMIGVRPDVWIPLMMAPQTRRNQELLTNRTAYWLFSAGRLKPGLTAAQAEADLKVLARRFAQAYPDSNEMYETAISPTTLLPGPARGYAITFSGLLMIVVALVLSIACANTASFLLARTNARRSELAVRSALGASRSRLFRQAMAESVLLACLSGGLGWILMKWTAPLLLLLTPPSLPIRFAFSSDYRVFGFTLLVSLLAALLFGLAPAWQGSRVDLATSLKDGMSARGAGKSRLRSLLVVGQVAICSLLLVGAGLCLRSLIHAQSIDLGFESGNRLIASLDLSSLGYSKAGGRAFFVKTSSDPASLLAALRREIGALDPNVAPTHLGSLRGHLAFALFPVRAASILISIFGLLALVLALAGLSGLIAYSVSRRTREIGIRMALGAETRDVLKMMIGEGILLTLIGMAIGLVAAIGLTRFLSDLLYGVSAIDPLTFSVIALLLIGNALVACWVPARRATKIDPLVALRCE